MASPWAAFWSGMQPLGGNIAQIFQQRRRQQQEQSRELQRNQRNVLESQYETAVERNDFHGLNLMKNQLVQEGHDPEFIDSTIKDMQTKYLANLDPYDFVARYTYGSGQYGPRVEGVDPIPSEVIEPIYEQQASAAWNKMEEGIQQQEESALERQIQEARLAQLAPKPEKKRVKKQKEVMGQLFWYYEGAADKVYPVTGVENILPLSGDIRQQRNQLVAEVEGHPSIKKLGAINSAYHALRAQIDSMEINGFDGVGGKQIGSINTFMRIIDPVAVRQGDVDLIKGSESYMKQFKIYLAKLDTDAVISKEMLRDLMDTATLIVGAYQRVAGDVVVNFNKSWREDIGGGRPLFNVNAINSTNNFTKTYFNEAHLFEFSVEDARRLRELTDKRVKGPKGVFTLPTQDERDEYLMLLRKQQGLVKHRASLENPQKKWNFPSGTPPFTPSGSTGSSGFTGSGRGQQLRPSLPLGSEKVSERPEEPKPFQSTDIPLDPIRPRLEEEDIGGPGIEEVKAFQSTDIPLDTIRPWLEEEDIGGPGIEEPKPFQSTDIPLDPIRPRLEEEDIGGPGIEEVRAFQSTDMPLDPIRPRLEEEDIGGPGIEEVKAFQSTDLFLDLIRPQELSETVSASESLQEIKETIPTDLDLDPVVKNLLADVFVDTEEDVGPIKQDKEITVTNKSLENQSKKGKYKIVIDPNTNVARIFVASGEQVVSYPVATGDITGTRYGAKYFTPTGVFKIIQKQKRPTGFKQEGPFKLRLNFKNSKGLYRHLLHGPYGLEEDIIKDGVFINKGYLSHGCIRFSIAHMLELVKYLEVGSEVEILPYKTSPLKENFFTKK